MDGSTSHTAFAAKHFFSSSPLAPVLLERRESRPPRSARVKHAQRQRSPHGVDAIVDRRHRHQVGLDKAVRRVSTRVRPVPNSLTLASCGTKSVPWIQPRSLAREQFVAPPFGSTPDVRDVIKTRRFATSPERPHAGVVTDAEIMRSAPSASGSASHSAGRPSRERPHLTHA